MVPHRTETKLSADGPPVADHLKVSDEWRGENRTHLEMPQVPETFEFSLLRDVRPTFLEQRSITSQRRQSGKPRIPCPLASPSRKPGAGHQPELSEY